MRSVALKPRVWDIAVIAGVLLTALAIALLLLPPKADPVFVQIWQDGALLYELPLDTDTELTVGGKYENTVTIRGGAVCVSHATCPGGDCVRSGSIRDAGRGIVCLPNRLEIRLVGASGVDAVAK